MITTVLGIVKDGRIVPASPLPEGSQVEIRICDPLAEVTPELQAELDSWEAASSEALELVERAAQEMDRHEAR